MLSDADFKTASSMESIGTYGHVAVRILTHGFKLDDERLGRIASRFVEKIRDAIQMETVKTDPESAKQREETINELLCCVPGPIWRKVIENGYWGVDDPWGWTSPWLYCVTIKGPITIGWRKRVISIDWSESDVKADADELFPTETVTKDGQLIHAWSLEDARRYLSKILMCDAKETAALESDGVIFKTCEACGGDGYFKGARLGDEPCHECKGEGVVRIGAKQ